MDSTIKLILSFSSGSSYKLISTRVPLSIAMLILILQAFRGDPSAHFNSVLQHLAGGLLLLFDHADHCGLLRKDLVLNRTFNVLLAC